MSERKIRCSFDGCAATTDLPFMDGWSDCSFEVERSKGLLKEGLYCKAHADALEANLAEGSLEEIQESLDEIRECMENQGRFEH
jgi:hypothetical protein